MRRVQKHGDYLKAKKHTLTSANTSCGYQSGLKYAVCEPTGFKYRRKIGGFQF